MPADLLRIAVLVAAVWGALGLVAQVARARAWGRREFFAPAAGDPRRGIRYAFGPGMSPAAKESAREHLPVWLAGVGFHLGAFAALGSLALLVAGSPVRGVAAPALGALTFAGGACGVALLLRRLFTPHLRGLSGPDDYLANLLTTVFAGLACARAFTPAAEGAFLVAGVAFLFYLPLGKIRHCLFFFATRYHSAYHFGRRGVLPPAA